MKVFKPYRFIDKKEIEQHANDLIKRIEEKRKRPLQWPLDASRVADFLDIGVVWQSIPPDDRGSIAAMILPTQREIIINKDVPGLDGGFGQSTLAHEIGHWELHVNHRAVNQFIDRLHGEIQLDIEPFLCRSVSGQLEKIEWQAQYFATCLLMPRHIMEAKQQGRDLTNSRHLQGMAKDIGVTTANLKHRLKDLKWIVTSKGSKQIYLGDAAPRKR